MAAEEGVIWSKDQSPFQGSGNEGHVMAHEVVPGFLSRQEILSLTVTTPCLNFWIGELFSFNGIKDLFPSIRNGENDDGYNKSDHRSRIKRQKESALGVTTKFDSRINS
jgi:hypothetical protein